MSRMDDLFELLSHIELAHERELDGPYNFTRLKGIHDEMHARREWDHSVEYMMYGFKTP